MTLLMCAVVGVVIGAVAGRFIPGSRSRFIGLNMLIGAAGAIFGGFAGAAIGLFGWTSLALSALVAFLAILGISAAGRRKTYREPETFASAVVPQPAEKEVTLPIDAIREHESSSMPAPREQAITSKPVPGSDRPHIFLSYATPDREIARALATALSREGFNVWWDRTIPPGKSFDEVIEQALDSARCVVVLWTTASASSNWVRAEAAEGLRRQILVPVLMEEEVRIPLEFRRIQAANLADWRSSADHPGFRSLLSSLVDTMGPSTQDSSA
jgi:uncharacterized membrane protein YeaQ/YmgE (transglycosylase-associated protein family)